MPKLEKTVREIHTLLNRLQYENTGRFDLSPETVGVINALETIPEWWKEHYKIPANDVRWISLTRETALEDYTRYVTKFAVNILKERYGFRKVQRATIMEKTKEEMKQEIEYVKKWVMEDNDALKDAASKAAGDPKKLEREIFGRELTQEEKEEMVRERMLKVMREEYGMQV